MSGHGVQRGTRAHQLSLLLALSMLAGLLAAAMALPVVGGVGAAAKTGAEAFNELPSELKEAPLAQRSVLLAGDGTTLATLSGDEDRVVVPMSDIPSTMRKAIVAIEDSRFYSHHGVDVRGTIRAAVKNGQAGGVTQGGSTITQQYVKLTLLEKARTPKERKAATARSVQRKLLEARYALALEKRLTKNEILERYLNIAYFGNGAYGVGTAALHYFGVPVQKLSLVQAAMLAGLVNSPAEFDPVAHPKAAKARRDLVLRRMAEVGFLKRTALPKALRTKLKVNSTPRRLDGCEGSPAPFFCDYVRNQLLTDGSFGETLEARRRAIFGGGLRVQTTLDMKVQEAAQKAVDSTINRSNRVATAIVVIKPGTGEVQAIAINRTYGASKKPGYTKVNYALSSAFQPGSTFKVFTLAAAIKAGLPLNTRISSPSCFVTPLYPVAARGTGSCRTGYSNASDSESGTFDMLTGTWHSVNTYYMQLAMRIGLDKVRDMARALGVTNNKLFEDDHGNAVGSGYRGLSMVIGSVEAKPIDMANAYATIAARGLRCDPHGVTSIASPDGKPVDFAKHTTCTRALDSAVADTVTSVLEGVITRGTGTNANIGRPAAGKTGTTDDYHAAWFAGYTPDLAAAVWVGDPRGNQEQYELRNVTANGRFYVHVFGGDLAAVIWGRAMRAALVGVPPSPFVRPDPVQIKRAMGRVPDVIGLTVSAARRDLERAGFAVVVGRKKVAGFPIPDDSVAASSPDAGTQLPLGGTVVLTVSNGERDEPTESPTPDKTASPSESPKATSSPTPKRTKKPK